MLISLYLIKTVLLNCRGRSFDNFIAWNILLILENQFNLNESLIFFNFVAFFLCCRLFSNNSL